MNPRNGKVARLPREVREELNRRLQLGEQGEALLDWLTGLDTVKAVVQKEFAGMAVTKQNLSEWRNGGFGEWRFKADMVHDSGEIEADAGEIGQVTHGRLADQLATALAGRYASLLRHWDGTVTEEFRAKLKVLRGLTVDIAHLRRWDHSAGRLRIEQDNHEALREKTEAEVVEHFEKWIKNPAVHDWIVETWVPKQERIRRRQEMFGLNEEELAHEREKVERQAAREKAGGKAKLQKSKSKENASAPRPEDDGGNSMIPDPAAAGALAGKPASRETSSSKAQGASHQVAPNRTSFSGTEARATGLEPAAEVAGETEVVEQTTDLIMEPVVAEKSNPVTPGQTGLSAREAEAEVAAVGSLDRQDASPTIEQNA